jgi:glyoxylate/hydroxypyruvate reductase
MPSILLAIHGWDVQPWMEQLKKALPHFDLIQMHDDFSPDRIDYAVAWKPEAGYLARFQNLKAIFSLGAGVDHIMHDPDLPKVPLARVVDPSLTMQMTEWVVLQVLFHHRQMHLYFEQQKAKMWRDHRSQPSAAEVRVGVMGLGVLGQDASRVLRALGFDVAGWSRTAKTDLDFPCYAGIDGLDAFLGRTDILVSLLPLTHETRGLLNAQIFAKLPRDGRLGGAFLINAGRGGLQVEADILAALDRGELLGASLDVFETEPLPLTSRLWSHPRVIVTPHNAAISQPERVAALVASQITTLESGGTLEHLVDYSRGY